MICSHPSSPYYYSFLLPTYFTSLQLWRRAVFPQTDASPAKSEKNQNVCTYFASIRYPMNSPDTRCLPRGSLASSRHAMTGFRGFRPDQAGKRVPNFDRFFFCFPLLSHSYSDGGTPRRDLIDCESASSRTPLSRTPLISKMSIAESRQFRPTFGIHLTRSRRQVVSR